MEEARRSTEISSQFHLICNTTGSSILELVIDRSLFGLFDWLCKLTLLPFNS